MKILAIETSCDETSIAILEVKKNHFKILSNIVSSQIKIHSPFGGVVPHLAKREHQENLVPILLKALEKARLIDSKTKKESARAQYKKRNSIKKMLTREPELLKRFESKILPMNSPGIDFIVVTSGPGLEPALWVGINFAKALGFLWRKRVVPISHLTGHIYSNWLKPVGINTKHEIRNIKLFPALNLIVSGGHTMLVLMIGHNKFKVIGDTLDDAAGEAFDKVAKLLKLGYPGGPVISKIATKGNAQKFPLPRPMLNQKNYNFSFSGLKTAVLYLIRDLNLKKITPKVKSDIAASFQQAAVDVLVKKTIKAAKEFKVKTILLSGGVSANLLLRKTLEKQISLELKSVVYMQPLLEYTGDNAAMIALAGYYKINKKMTSKKIEADSNKKFS